MGRPIKKRFFGNKNAGETYGQIGVNSGIGGEGIASVSQPDAGRGSININDTYKHFPTLTVAAPDEPTGVTAVLAVTWEIESITVGGTNTGYTINQTGAAVTALVGLYGQASVTPVLTINTNGSGNVSAINITSRGEFTSIDGTGITTWGIQGAGGSNAQATVKFRVKSIAVTTAGSGYNSAPTLTWATLGGTSPSLNVPTLTTTFSGDSSQQFPVGPSLVGFAYVAGSGSAQEYDIIKQESSHRYLVKTGATGQYIGQCKLVAVATGSLAAGQMNLTASDAGGGTYYITKLTARRAVVTQYGSGPWTYTTGQTAPWKVIAPAGVYIQPSVTV